MADVLTIEQRQRNMRNIKGKNTKPEMVLRKALHARGVRYRLHVKELPGSPDLVFPKYHAVIFVHGCFWHQHGCKYTSMPSTRTEFWQNKLSKNMVRDKENIQKLEQAGWRVYTVWECSLRNKINLPEICNELILFLTTNEI